MSAVNIVGCTRNFSNKLYKSTFKQGPLCKISFNNVVSLYFALSSKTILSLVVELFCLTTSLRDKYTTFSNDSN